MDCENDLAKRSPTKHNLANVGLMLTPTVATFAKWLVFAEIWLHIDS